MDVKLEDLVKRTWIMINNSAGVLLLHMDPKLDTNFFVPDFRSRYSSIYLNNSEGWNSVPAHLRRKVESAVGDFPTGIFFNYPEDSFKVLSEWNYMNRRTNRTAFLIYEREALDAVKINCVITMSCADYIFAQNMLPQAGILYKNKDTLTNALQIPGVPKISHLKELWNKWVSSHNLFGYSRKYFCEKAYGYPAQLPLIRERHLTLQKDDREKMLYIMLQALAMEGYEIKSLMNMGFVWNRYIQAWIGEESTLAVRELDDFLRRDSLATPATMGFVPEWYAGLDLAGIIRSHTTRGMTAKNSTRAFDNTGLWNVIV